MNVESLRDFQPTSQIAQERVEPGKGSRVFLVGAVLITFVAFGLAAQLGLRPLAPVAAEEAAKIAPAGLLDSFGVSWGRLISAGAFAIAVAATMVAARRLLHSEPVAILAGLLTLLDPGFLVLGRLAIPDAIAVAGLMCSLAFFLGTTERSHWAGTISLGIAVAADPNSLVWGVPLAILILIRGHIYAAPRHLGLAGLQTLAIPALAAGLHLLATDGSSRGIACQPDIARSLFLAVTVDHGGVYAMHNPVTWIGGGGAILFLVAGALSAVSRQFRLARLPGRIQMRLAVPLQPIQARMLWIFLFVLLIPYPSALAPLLAMALAAGIGHLADDAPGFGAAVGVVALAFAVMALVRGWDLVTGAADPAAAGELLGLVVPWTTVVPCP